MTDPAPPTRPGALPIIATWIAGAIVVALAFLLSIHPYEWSEDPRLAAQVDHDSVLGIMMVALLGALALSLELWLSARAMSRGRPKLGLFGIVTGGLLFAGAMFRLLQVLPQFRG